MQDKTTISPVAENPRRIGSGRKIVRLDEGLSAQDHAEHVANVARMRRIGAVGAIVMVLFAPADLALAWLRPEGFLPLLAIRFAAALIWAVAWARLHYGKIPSIWLFSLIDLAVFGAASLAMSLCATFSGGLESIYIQGVYVALICRGLVLPAPWRVGAPRMCFIGGIFPLTMFAAAVVSPTIRSQFWDPHTLVEFVVGVATLGAATFLLVVGGDVICSVRRETYEQKQLGGYQLLEKLGSGGMGEVWRAHYAPLRRDVALKILRWGFDDDGAVERFEREVEALAALRHPNTVRIYDFGVSEDGMYYFAMEFVPGVTLASVLRGGALEVGRAVRIAHQVARALGEAHCAGILHRDIKPSNILVSNIGDERDLVKLIDFGVAKNIFLESDQTMSGSVLGTPAYMSPEQARGEAALPASDVYSLGVVLWMMLSGRRLFDTEGSEQAMLAHMNQKPRLLSEVVAEALPPGLESLVALALEKNPNRRPVNGDAFASALVRFLADSNGIPSVRTTEPRGA